MTGSRGSAAALGPPPHPGRAHRLGHPIGAGGAPIDPGRHQLYERALRLIAAVLRSASPGRVASGRPGSARARHALAAAAREALAERPERTLPELARELTVSPHHLSRVFSAITGQTISRHRMRLRTRAVLERLAAGEDDLVCLAADLGFTDQSHLYRVVRSETDVAPSVLRRLLS